MYHFPKLIAWLACWLTSAALLSAPGWAQDNRNLAVKHQAVPTIADKRVALVIGNSAYQKGPLKNPVNDANDIAAKLRALGFDVIERKDLKTSQIGRTLREFRSKLSNGAVALFFYAGHGLQIKGENYLPTVDADIEGEEDVPNQSIAVRQVMELMEDAKTRLNLAFLDACRNNPYSRSFRSAGEGLARVSTPSGTLISFATRPGSVAADGAGRNGLYTTHLLDAMEMPNQPVELMLKQVTSAVKGASRGSQEPWMEGSIEGNFYFRVAAAKPEPALVVAPAVTNSAPQQEAIDRAVQEAVRRSSEQAARERTELNERAARERAELNERAARERAELQASMQKLIEQALARQSAANDASHRRASQSAEAPATTVAALGPSTTLAATRPLAFASGKAPQPGDEWEYLARESMWGKQKRLLWRVRAVAPDAGVLEELIVDGKPVQEWAFSGKADLVGTPTDASIFFGSHWDGRDFPTLSVSGVGDCNTRLRCELIAKVVGKERISVPAGTFDAVHIKGFITISFSGPRVTAGAVSIWYSEQDRRLLKQTVVVRATNVGMNINETLELQSVRLARP